MCSIILNVKLYYCESPARLLITKEMAEISVIAHYQLAQYLTFTCQYLDIVFFPPQDHAWLVTGAKLEHPRPAHSMDPPASCVHLVNTVHQVGTLFIHLDKHIDFAQQN